MSEKTTPIRKQYLDIKRQYPDALLFFRLGDFYETFDDDAEVAARELDIVLTSRNIAKGVRVPMAGIPHHAIDAYLARLIEKGYHVAICEQVGDGPVRGLFPREVVRVVTPGTVIEPGLLPADSNNYLAAISIGEDSVGIAYADISTGEFAAMQEQTKLPHLILRQEISRLNPAEIIIAEGTDLDHDLPGHRTELPSWKFEPAECEETLREHLGVATLEGFGFSNKPQAIAAAGAIIKYLAETQKAVLPLLTDISTYEISEFMSLDSSTRRNLELTETIREKQVQGSLFGVIDQTITSMGRRLLRQWLSKPLLEITRIKDRHDQVQAFHDEGMLRTELRSALRPLGDLERLANRAITLTARPRDLDALRGFLRNLPEITHLLEGHSNESIADIAAGIDDCADLRNLLEAALVDEPPSTLSQTGIFRNGYSSELDELLDSTSGSRKWIAELESIERQRTGISTLKVGFNKVFGYYIEVTKAKSDLVPDEYIRKQTLVNAERFITPQMKEVEAKVLAAEEEIRELETSLFYDLCSKIAEFGQRLSTTAATIARLDVVSALAELAVNKNYVRPKMVEQSVLEIRDGRHPVVEEFLGSGLRFVPNDIVMEQGERIRILTGPNMSGKSTYLRQVALICLLAQMGSYVPARSATLGRADRIFTRIGAQDEIHAGQSTFMVEMVEAANILHHATSDSLLIFDEIGRGTSTYDGISIAWSVVEYIHNHPKLRARTLFATHYHELTKLADALPAVCNYNVAVAEEGNRVIFLHKIVPGGADRSYGIHVAEMAGMPRAVIHRAQEMLAQLEDGQPEEGSEVSKQLSFLRDQHPLQEALRDIEIESLTPLEALNLLYEWQRRFANEDDQAV
jgi:DNA mismatch repair protein MutS